MYICVCKGITQNDIQEFIENSSIASPEEAEKVCGAGGDCGACRVKLERLFANPVVGALLSEQNMKKQAG